MHSTLKPVSFLQYTQCTCIHLTDVWMCIVLMAYFIRMRTSFFTTGPGGEPPICRLVVISELFLPAHFTLCLLSHRVGDECPAPPLRRPPTHHPPPHYLLYLMGPLLFPPPPLAPSLLLFIYLFILPRLCGLPFLISSVKHDYYLLMLKLRGHSFCHPRRCIFPA